MHISAKTRLAIGVPIIAIGLTAAIATRSPVAHAQVSPECALSVRDVIPIGSEPTSVSVTFTSTIGDTLSATFQSEANVEVVSLARGRDDGPLTATMLLNTARASAGRWEVTARGDKGTCAGNVVIGTGVKRAQGLHDSAAAAPRARRSTCAAFIDDSIVAGLDRTEILAKYSEPIGQAVTASFPKGAGIDVISTKRGPGDEAMSRRLVLNTTRAVSGQWRLAMTGDSDECAGNVYVGKKSR